MRNRRSFSTAGFRRSGGYIIEQLLISLGTCAFLIPVAASLFAILLHALKQPLRSQDETGVAQLRRVISVSTDLICTDNQIQLHHHGKEQILRFVNGKVALTNPGTQIFLSDLESAQFSTDGGLLYVTYTHPNEEPVTRCLGPDG